MTRRERSAATVDAPVPDAVPTWAGRALTRRSALGLGIGLGATAAGVLAAPGAHGAALTSGVTPTRDQAQPGDQHIQLTSFAEHDLRRGEHHGTRVDHDALRIESPTSLRSYVDPFGSGAAVE